MKAIRRLLVLAIAVAMATPLFPRPAAATITCDDYWALQVRRADGSEVYNWNPQSPRPLNQGEQLSVWWALPRTRPATDANGNEYCEPVLGTAYFHFELSWEDHAGRVTRKVYEHRAVSRRLSSPHHITVPAVPAHTGEWAAQLSVSAFLREGPDTGEGGWPNQHTYVQWPPSTLSPSTPCPEPSTSTAVAPCPTGMRQRSGVARGQRLPWRVATPQLGTTVNLEGIHPLPQGTRAGRAGVWGAGAQAGTVLVSSDPAVAPDGRYSMNLRNKANTLIGGWRTHVWVDSRPPEQMRVRSLDGTRTRVYSGEEITVAWGGVPGAYYDDEIVIVPQNFANEFAADPVLVRPTGGNPTGRTRFRAPRTPGTYVASIRHPGERPIDSVMRSNYFVVVPGAVGTGGGSSFDTGDAMTVRWDQIQNPGAGDVVVLIDTRTGAEVARVSASGLADGSALLSLPLTLQPGSAYELRYLSGGTRVVAVSGVISIDAPALDAKIDDIRENARATLVWSNIGTHDAADRILLVGAGAVRPLTGTAIGGHSGGQFVTEPLAPGRYHLHFVRDSDRERFVVTQAAFDVHETPRVGGPTTIPVNQVSTLPLTWETPSLAGVEYTIVKYRTDQPDKRTTTKLTSRPADLKVKPVTAGGIVLELYSDGVKVAARRVTAQ